MSMNVNRSHDVIFKRLLSIIKCLDDELRVYVPFIRISVISGQWKGKHERPWAMKRRLASVRISPSAGFEPETPWSDFESAKSPAMRSLLMRSRKQENVTLAMLPIIRIGTKTIFPFPFVGWRKDGGADTTSRLCFDSLIILYRIGDINDIKTIKLNLKSRLYYGGLCPSHLYPPHTHTLLIFVPGHYCQRLPPSHVSFSRPTR